MKPEKWISCLVGMVLAFLVSFGGMGCLISAFGLDVSMTVVGLGCGLAAVGGTFCYLLKRGDAIVACVFALTLGYLWRRGTLVTSFETLVYMISVRYDGGYGWGTLGKLSGTANVAVLIVGCVITLETARMVCRRDSLFPALTVALVPLLLCVVVTDTVPEEGYLFLLLLGIIILLLTGGLRRGDAGQANTLTAMAAVPLVIALGVLFWLVPRDSYVNRTEEMQDKLIQWAAGVPELWEDLTTSEKVVAANDDRTQRVDLESLGPRKEYTYAVMDVYAETGGTLYLREQDYDNYTGTGWTNTVNRREEFYRSGDIAWQNAGTVSIVTKRARDVFYYPYYPEEGLTLAGGCVVNDQSFTAYDVERYTLPVNWRQLLTGESGGGTQLQFPVGNAGSTNYRKLPADTQAWAEGLLASVLTEGMTDTEKADAIADYVRGSALYDLNTEKMDSDAEDFARWFLEESDTGYCVHFATATAVLLRAAGVESRYVTGYLAQVRAGDWVTVTAAEAHAWVEYYESELGTWIVLEATPGDLTAGTGETTEATEPDPSGGTESVPRTDPTDTQPGIAAEATEGTNTGGAAGDDTPEEPEKQRRGSGWLLVVLLIAAVPAQREVRIRLRRGRMYRGGANRRALAMWREVTLCAKLLKRKAPGELEALAQKAKFSQHTLTAQELMVFDTWLREAKRQLKDKPWYLRLLYGLVFAL